MEHYRGWDTVLEITKASCLNQPSKVTTSVRHRTSTYYVNVSRAERVNFLKHKGHSEEVSNNIYTTPSSYRELCKVGIFCKALDEGHLNPV
ncbi:hypothetical protein ACJMK2_036277 [Sinanodonta woodiana]|uniref:Uncharacterized protein n=1 Tax=Sinanodonta woodiana TaxID=1069815 RepID=A0ABD3WHV9_SINWO